MRIEVIQSFLDPVTWGESKYTSGRSHRTVIGFHRTRWRKHTHLSAVFDSSISLPTAARIQTIRQKSAESITPIASAGTHWVVQGMNIISGICSAAMKIMMPQNQLRRLSFHFRAMRNPNIAMQFSTGKAIFSLPDRSQSQIIGKQKAIQVNKTLRGMRIFLAVCMSFLMSLINGNSQPPSQFCSRHRQSMLQPLAH